MENLLEGLSPHDSKVIRENPDLSPYELVALKNGISQKGYDKLITAGYKPGDLKKDEPPTDSPPPPKPPKDLVWDDPIPQISSESNPLKPDEIRPVEMGKKTPHKAQTRPPERLGDTVTISGRNGLPRKINAREAERLIRKYPNEFRLIDEEPKNDGHGKSRG